MQSIERSGVLGGLILAAGLALAAPAWASEPAAAPAAGATGKIPVKTADDLPRHVYKIEGKASEFLVSDAPFKAFVEQVRANIESDLAKYDITDKTTLRGYQMQLMQIAVFQGREADALKHLENARELETKESTRLMMGQSLLSMFAARREAGGDQAKFVSAFERELNQRVSRLPWDKVRESVLQARSQAQIINRELVLGQIKGGLDPVVEANKGEVSGDLVGGLISARNLLDNMIALQPSIAKVYGALAESNAKPRVDVLSANNVTLAPDTKASPVVIAIWDSGVDTSIFSGQLWTNEREKADGKDDDANGFVDDVHGIAYDMEMRRTSGLLSPIDEMKSPLELVMKYTKGSSDSQAGVDSTDAQAFRSYISSLKAEEVTPFIEDLGLFGNYSHGTHVAGIAAEGNPFARLLGIRLTFDHKTIPRYDMDLAAAERWATSFRETAAYMKQAGVRVVNMSWGLSRQDIEGMLEQRAAVKDPAERAEMSRKIFAIMRKGMEDAMKSAPEILFVPAAGNSDNDNQFSEMMPTGISLPNVLSIGAIDSSGKPTGFTTFGSNVVLYANGFEVESFVPGGKRMKYSGTSMAAPNVTNLVGKMLAVNPSLTVPQIIEALKKNADPMAGYEGRYIINPKRTIDAVKK